MIDPVFPTMDHGRTGISTTILFMGRIMNANNLGCQPYAQPIKSSWITQNECEKQSLTFLRMIPLIH